MEVDYLDLVGEGYMGSMQWQLGREMGTIPAFASRTQENKENLSSSHFLQPSNIFFQFTCVSSRVFFLSGFCTKICKNFTILISLAIRPIRLVFPGLVGDLWQAASFHAGYGVTQHSNYRN